MAPHPTHFILPDLFADWPFESTPNSNAKVIADSERWLEAYQILAPDVQAVFNSHKFGLLAACVYPQLPGAQLRAGCDLMNAFFLFEIFSDGRTSEEVVNLSKTYMDALRYPLKEPQVHERSTLGAIIRSFWSRALELASASSAERFIYHFEAYMAAVIQEAVDREQGHLPSVNEYMLLRRRTIGVYPSIALLLFQVHIPDEYINHPVVAMLEKYTAEMVFIGNDVCSWNVEQADNNDQHNLVTIVMKEKSLSLQEAMDHIGSMYSTTRRKFLATFNNLPSMDPKYDPLIKDYCQSLGKFVTGNHQWSYLTERYFGMDGADILKTGRVEVKDKCDSST